MASFLLVFSALTASELGADAPNENQPNVILITVDDMSCDSVGVYGCKVPGTTPRMDAFAAESLRFAHAHTQVGNCMPCRNVLMTGLYPHQNGIEGFRQIREGHQPQLCDDFRAAGYLTAIHGKASHSNPFHPYPGWDLQLGADSDKKKPAAFGASTAEAIRKSAEQNKPLFLSINISDPHKPFYGVGKRGEDFDDPNKPSRVYTADEVVVPGFLFDHPAVRKELAQYYSSVRRADDAFGAILDEIDRADVASETIVVFFSDHGMPLPFAKTQLYHHSTHTPLMVRWPDHTQPGSVDDLHMVSVVDIAPTLLDATGVSTERIMAGRSFVPLLNGRKQDNRDYVIKTYYENSGRNRQPMRSIQTKTLGYIFNPWSGENASGDLRNFATATDGTATYKAMQKVASSDRTVAARLALMDHRVPEELFDYSKDPDALNNLIDSTAHKADLKRLRNLLLQEMRRIEDPMADVFASNDPATTAAYMLTVDAEMAAIKGANRKPKASVRKRRDLIAIKEPIAISNDVATVAIHHTFPKRLGNQTLTVTMKNESGERIERKTATASGDGIASLTFDVPADVTSIQFAAFVGTDYPSTPQHITSDAFATK